MPVGQPSFGRLARGRGGGGVTGILTHSVSSVATHAHAPTPRQAPGRQPVLYARPFRGGQRARRPAAGAERVLPAACPAPPGAQVRVPPGAGGAALPRLQAEAAGGALLPPGEGCECVWGGVGMGGPSGVAAARVCHCQPRLSAMSAACPVCPQVLACYGNHGWKFMGEHLHDILGKQCAGGCGPRGRRRGCPREEGGHLHDILGQAVRGWAAANTFVSLLRLIDRPLCVAAVQGLAQRHWPLCRPPPPSLPRRAG